jgi:hypothetical protein
MKTDRYTKTILTIIAAALVWIALGGPSLAPSAHAQSERERDSQSQFVYIAGWVEAGRTRKFSTEPFAPGLPISPVCGWATPVPCK